MPLFDTHTHIYLSKEKTEETIIKEMENDTELVYIASIGTDLETSQHSINLAKKHHSIIPTIGIHPCSVEMYKDTLQETLDALETMIQKEKIYAIGECGLDYYRLPPRLTDSTLNTEDLKSLQEAFFRGQIQLAQKYHLPLVIHNREAGTDVVKILKETNCKNFVFHCFSEDISFARELLSFAPQCMISFSGIVTFNSAKSIQETAQNIPLKNILIETDCPYLAPTPKRGSENYPNYVRYVLEKIQSLRHEEKMEIEKTIFENSLRFYGI